MVRSGSSAFPRFSLILVGALALAGCDTMPGTSAAPVAEGAEGTVQRASGPSQRVIERDVEAPEVFQVEDSGLWDGRPSLGGVWIAHPSVRDPERALIRNTTTGATVIGALFRRERENPGPSFQVSSEAANALGILPGAPTGISVTALRLQRVEMEIDPAPEPATAVDETLAIAPVTPAADAPVSQAAAATPSGQPEGQVEIVAEEAPRRGLRGLFSRRDRAPETAIAETTLAPVAGVATVATAATAATADAAIVAVPNVAAPDLSAPDLSAPAPERRSLRDLFRRRQPEPDTTLIALPGTDAMAAAPTAPQPQPAAPSAPPRQTSAIDRPFVQIGIFSVEQNAQNARSQMQRAGFSAEIRRGRVGENLFWRVVVGPAMTTAERSETQRRVRAMGFADAYAVVR